MPDFRCTPHKAVRIFHSFAMSFPSIFSSFSTLSTFWKCSASHPFLMIEHHHSLMGSLIGFQIYHSSGPQLKEWGIFRFLSLLGLANSSLHISGMAWTTLLVLCALESHIPTHFGDPSSSLPSFIGKMCALFALPTSPHLLTPGQSTRPPPSFCHSAMTRVMYLLGKSRYQ